MKSNSDSDGRQSDGGAVAAAMIVGDSFEDAGGDGISCGGGCGDSIEGGVVIVG